MKKKDFRDKVTISEQAWKYYNQDREFKKQSEDNYEVIKMKELPATPSSQTVSLGLYFIVFSCVFTSLAIAYFISHTFILPAYELIMKGLS